jgi:hypothetical protein
LKRDRPDRIFPEDWVDTFEDALTISTHRLREAVLWKVLVPLLVVPVTFRWVLLVLDTLQIIAPIRNGVLAIVASVLGANVLGCAISAGFGWLFR